MTNEEYMIIQDSLDLVGFHNLYLDNPSVFRCIALDSEFNIFVIAKNFRLAKDWASYHNIPPSMWRYVGEGSSYKLEGIRKARYIELYSGFFPGISAIHNIIAWNVSLGRLIKFDEKDYPRCFHSVKPNNYDILIVD